MKKKILILISSLIVGGGAEKVASIITKKLSKKYNIFILTFNDYKNLYSFKGKYHSLKENLWIHRIILISFRIYIINRIIRIYNFIKLISPDLIISMKGSSNNFAIFTKFLFRIKIPLIIAIHNNPNMHYKLTSNKKEKLLMKLLSRLKLVNKIVSVSKDIQHILELDFKIEKKKIITIYNGIELKKIQKMKEEKILKFQEIFNDTNLIKFITVGRFTAEKGHKYLIEAFSRVKEDVVNSKLIIIGDGLLRSELIMLIKKKNLENDIILLGFKNNPFKFLLKSDIFVLSSISEGFPTVLLEALACGLPIISTNCKTGPKEILDNGKYGFLVKPMNSGDLAKKMIMLAKSPDLLKKYSRKSAQRAKFFDFEIIINDWIDLIESNINQKDKI